MAQDYVEPRAQQTLLQVSLTPEQISQIEKVTGVRLATLDVVSLTGDAARAVSSQLVSATAIVPCW